VVFHIARTIDVFGFVAAALKFVENRAVRLAHHIGQHRQTPPVRHADNDVLHAQIAAALDDLFHRGDQAFTTIEAKAFGAHVFDMQEFFKPLRLHQLVQDGAAAFTGEGDFLAVAFDPFLQPCGLFGVGNVHVLQREGAAIGAAHDIHDLAHRGMRQAQHIVDEDRAVHVGIRKTVGCGVEFRLVLGIALAQGIDIGGKMATDAVGADDHQGADRVEHGALDLVLGQLHVLFGGLGGDLFCRAFGIFRRRNRPFAGQGGGQIVHGLRRPVAPGPAWAIGGTAGVRLGIAYGFEEIGPSGIDGRGVGGVFGRELTDVVGVGPIKGGGVERGGVVVGHGDAPS
jgi:hypothetical protein